MKTTILILLATVSIAHATFIPLGDVTFTGNFTRNPLYDFNNPGAQPYGSFGEQTVLSSYGIFSPYIQPGMTLNSQTLWTIGALPIFTIGGFTLSTSLNSIETTGGQGSFVSGFVDFSGNGFTPPDPSFFVDWFFWAPYKYDGTGPIKLVFHSGYDNGHVPDTGSTLALMISGLLGLFFYARRIHCT